VLPAKRRQLREAGMGLMDVLNGMRNGPRGQMPSGASSGGMSPITMGLLALLAYKAFKGGGILGSGAPAAQPAPQAGPQNRDGGTGHDWLGGLGGLLAGGAAGSVLTGGLGELVRRFQDNGQGHTAQSWIGRGQNDPISPNDLEKAVGAEDLDALARQTGVPRQQLLQELSAELPKTVDQLTPEGRVPTEREAERWV
jgi:uncharacterized protein YidB (DUF937 family)